MSADEPLGTRTPDELRAEFDRGFAEPATAHADDIEGFLVVRCAGTSYLLALAELAGFVAGRRIVALPSRAPHLLGVTGVRGVVTPVYDLAAVLGHEPTRATPNWIAITRGGRLGLAFADFGGHARSARATWIHGAHRRPTASVDGILHQVVDLTALAADIENHVRRGAQSQE